MTALTGRMPPAERWTREWLVDAVLAAALAAIALSSVLTNDPSIAGEFREPDTSLVLLALLGSLPLVARRRWPLAVHTTMVIALVLIGTRGYNTGLVTACLMFSLYTVAAHRSRLAAVAGLVVLYAGLVALGLGDAYYFRFDDWLGWIATAGFVIAWALGLLVRRWREDRERALARALAAERTRAAAAERAVMAERLRIAREMHDIVAHTLSVIAVQSATARHQLDSYPERAGAALGTIEQASRAALDDLRRMLGILRTDHGHSEPPGLAPSPGVADIELLVSAHRATHGPVEITVDPAVETAPESLRTTVFRLVQESLTNIRKHADGASATVSIIADGDSVIVDVTDDGPATSDATSPAGEPGLGLAGMRERVAMFDGGLEAGPCEDGGFRVRAVLRRATDREVVA
jgi:signal transduction histidine kinase